MDCCSGNHGGEAGGLESRPWSSAREGQVDPAPQWCPERKQDTSFLPSQAKNLLPEPGTQGITEVDA